MDRSVRDNAVKIVNELIDAEYKRLKEIAGDDETDSVFVEGYTESDIYVQANIPGHIAAQILLNYDYPIYAVLHLDYPQEMWKSLARYIGISSVESIDI